MHFFSRTDQSVLGRWWWTVDRSLLALLAVLITFGVVMVVAASPSVAMRINLNQYHFIIRHLIVLVPSIAVMVGISFFNIKSVWRLSALMLITCLVMLVYVLGFGMEIKGAQRWIHLPGFSLQPSEFAKPSFLVVAAWFIAKKKENGKFPGTKIAAALYGVLATLLVMQPDIGMTFVVTVCFVTIIFLAGLPLRIIAMLVIVAISGVLLAYFSLPHVQKRVDVFLDPAKGDSYQIDQSLDAFRQGGLLGTGPGQGNVKLSIPDVHADFIFSVVGEEFGLLFVVLLVVLYGLIIFRGFNKSMESDNVFVILSVGGLLTMFGIQALIHMGSALSLLPTKGMTLPFVSYGGSSLLSISIAMGMVLALTRRQARATIARAV